MMWRFLFPVSKDRESSNKDIKKSLRKRRDSYFKLLLTIKHSLYLSPLLSLLQRCCLVQVNSG